MFFRRKGSMECDVEDNSAKCGCTYSSCSRKGKCCECIRYHWRNQELPGCLFPPQLEKTYDRSLENFVAYWKERV
jgi:hypothetical protein